MAKKKKGKKKGKKRGGGRKKTNKRKPIQRGLMGKVGAAIMGAGPPVIAGLAAAGFAHGHHKAHGNIVETARLGFMQFLNEIGNGVIGAAPFEGPVKFVNKDGATIQGSLAPSLPKGSLLSVIATGLVLLGADALASKLAGGRPIKLIGTNMNVTGGS